MVDKGEKEHQERGKASNVAQSTHKQKSANTVLDVVLVLYILSAVHFSGVYGNKIVSRHLHGTKEQPAWVALSVKVKRLWVTVATSGGRPGPDDHQAPARVQGQVLVEGYPVVEVAEHQGVRPGSQHLPDGPIPDERAIVVVVVVKTWFVLVV